MDAFIKKMFLACSFFFFFFLESTANVKIDFLCSFFFIPNNAACTAAASGAGRPQFTRCEAIRVSFPEAMN